MNKLNRPPNHFRIPNLNATFSPDRKYRYQLKRDLGPDLRPCLFIMLNPSSADEVNDDPTVRRCINFAKSWGYGKLIVCNLFALRATKPDVLLTHKNPVGIENDAAITGTIQQVIDQGGIVVCAWGAFGAYKNQGARILQIIKNLNAPAFFLEKTKGNQPAHPLYLKATTTLKSIDKL